jgi:type IV secretory pathway VirD2 relaxase
VADRFAGRPLFDVASHARRGPGRRDRLTAAEIEQVRRTVGRVPEVMVKVLTRGAVTPSQVRQHAAYIGREGDLALETDDGQRLTGEDAGSRLVEDWDLDLPVAGSAERVARGGGRDARLVHKLIFSMPPGTPPDKVLGAVRDFAREEFGLTHRYALALHTDEPHPHVHLLVKAVSEQGERLNIRKETLRRWRAGFAEQLRARGVAANATERAVRGQSKKALKDGIHRAAERGRSTHVRERLRVAAELVASGTRRPVDEGERRLRDTNERIWAGYLAVTDRLLDQGDRNLSDQVRRFADRIRYPSTEQEYDRERIRELLRQRERSRDLDISR